jgi:hypothetical protein
MNASHVLAAATAALATVVPGAAAQDDSYYVKVKPNLGLKVKPKRDRIAPFKYVATGKLGLNGAPKKQGCKGTVSLRVRRGARTVAKGTTRITPGCTYSKKLKVRKSKLNGLKSGTLKFSARFGGNTVLQPDSAPNKNVRFG